MINNSNCDRYISIDRSVRALMSRYRILARAGISGTV